MTLQRFLTDRRGVAAMELGIVAMFLVLLMLPIADVAVAALTYMRVEQAMRNVGGFVQYNPPANAIHPETAWTIPGMDGYSIQPIASTSITPPTASEPGETTTINITVLCGEPPTDGSAVTPCTANDPTQPKYFFMIANVRLHPFMESLHLLDSTAGLTGGTITYTERYQ